jgi:chaperone LolA
MRWPALPVLLLLPSLLGAQVAGTPESGEAIMRRAASVYRGLNSFRADFKQEWRDDFVERSTEKGTLYQQGPNQFAMRFTDPKGGAYVLDGRSIWFYDPENLPGQVAKWPASEGADPLTNYNVVQRFLDRPVEKYRSIWLRTEVVDGNTTDVIRLEPLAPDMGFRVATLWIDRDATLLRKIEIDEKIQVRIVTLSRLRTNTAIPAEVFRFVPPSGVRVLEQ